MQSLGVKLCIFLTKQKDRNGPGPEMGMLRKLIERVRVLT